LFLIQHYLSGYEKLISNYIHHAVGIAIPITEIEI
jgi:hypothetical protein